MRLSTFAFSAALAGAALAAGAFTSSAQAAVVTIKVGGTYAAGSEASLAPTGPVSGEIFVETTPFGTIAEYTIFEILGGSYITFGTADNNYTYDVGLDESSTFIAQSANNNFMALTNGQDRFTLRFSPQSSDPTTLYDFASTPVGTELNQSSHNLDFTLAIGGRPTRGGPHWYPTFNLTFTTQAAPGAVPEPATWALMIGGFGLAGAALRRRRTDAATA